jgi:catechol-2,3-dioxygenase
MAAKGSDLMIGSLDMVALDAPDIDALAGFYAALAGWRKTQADDDWVTLTTDDGWQIGFQPAPDHKRPAWPDPARPQQAHLDIRVPDMEAASARAVELGATLLRRNETWHTLADAAGHPFDLCHKPDDPRTTLMGVMLDCRDAKALSAFYAELLGKPVTYEADGMAMIGDDGEQPVCSSRSLTTRRRAGRIRTIRSSTTSTCWSTTSRRPRRRRWRWVLPGCPATATPGGSTPTRPASRSA